MKHWTSLRDTRGEACIRVECRDLRYCSLNEEFMSNMGFIRKTTKLQRIMSLYSVFLMINSIGSSTCRNQLLGCI